MKKPALKTLVLFAGLIIVSCTAAEKQGNKENPAISGTIENGYRVLELKPESDVVDFTVYRGDYIKFRNTVDGEVFKVPGIGIEESFENTENYVKMKNTGEFPYTYGKFSGTINVVEFVQQRYHEVTSQQAADMIRKVDPVILDVRTPGEYMSGHIQDAILIPVQNFQERVDELEKFKNSPVLVYCASGNRSTVASRLLINAGFNNVSNLRYGIQDWIRADFPVVRSQ